MANTAHTSCHSECNRIKLANQHETQKHVIMSFEEQKAVKKLPYPT